MFDTECLHTPYLPPPTSSSACSPPVKDTADNQVPEADLLNLNDPPTNSKRSTSPKRKTGFSKQPGGRRKSGAGTEETMTESDGEEEIEEEEWVPDVFVFEYGTVVIWGMTEKEEKTFLKTL